MVALQVYDPFAKSLPDVGLVKVCDLETGHEMYIDTSDKNLRRAHADYWSSRQKTLDVLFKKTNVDNVSIATNEDYVSSLLSLFKMRA